MTTVLASSRRKPGSRATSSESGSPDSGLRRNDAIPRYAELDVTTMEGLLKGRGGEGLQSGDLAIEAVTLREEEASILEAPLASAAFQIEHVFYDFDARPVSWGWFICRADRFKLRTRIGPAAG